MSYHIHLLHTDGCDDADVAAAASLLDERERARRDRFVFPEHARLYTLGRGLLRRVLGDRLGCCPRELRFALDEHGKPRVDGARLDFNLSHTSGLVALGVTESGAIGVDVEKIERAADALELARHCFAPHEAEDVARAPEHERTERFLRYWTLKESYLKARGLGLRRPLDACAFFLGEPIRFVARCDLGDLPERWSFEQRRVGAGHLLAICAERGLEAGRARTAATIRSTAAAGGLVGRDDELAALIGAFAAGGGSRWLITGPPGSGKTRLAAELVAAARARDPRVLVISGRGDPLRTGTPLATLASLAHGATSCAGLAASPDDRRSDMYFERAAGALEAWLASACDAGPVALVLDDLHWADLPSVRVLVTALRRLAQRSLMVVAAARPSVRERFGDELAELAPEQIVLGELSSVDRRRLAASLLGAATDAAAVERVVAHAGGLPLFLEEAARASLGGIEPGPGETIAATVTRRMERLPDGARALLRAGSVLGQRFPLAAAAAVLGAEEAPDGAVDELVRGGLLRVDGAVLELGHIYLRDAAYALLADEERRTAHRRAARWLERAGGDLRWEALAGHHERAGDRGAARHAYERAAAQALRAADFAAATRLADEGLGCAAGGRDVSLMTIAAESLNWLGNHARAYQLAKEAAALVPAGSEASARVLSELAIACGAVGDRDMLLTIQECLVASLEARADLAEPAACAQTRAACVLIFALTVSGMRQFVDPWILRHLEWVEAAQGSAADGRVWGDGLAARGLLALYEGAHERAAELMRLAGDAYHRAGAVAPARAQWGNAGFALIDLGAFGDAIELLGRSAYVTDGGLEPSDCRTNLGRALVCAGRVDEGIAVLEAGLAGVRPRGSKRGLAIIQLYLAEAYHRRGDAALARELAARAADALHEFPTLAAPAAAVHALILLAQGAVDAALEQATFAMRLLDELGGVEERESLIRFVHARALAGAGHAGAARRAIRAALDRLLARAAILSPARRRTFLEDVAENRETLSWATLPESA